MTQRSNPQRDLVRLVRSALAHLYDHAYLQKHPLASMLDAEGNLDHVARAQRLRRVLLDCIEILQPEEDGSPLREPARAHAILTYRYVDGLDIDEIAARLGLSRRHAYREHEKGLGAVAELLWDRLQQAGGHGVPPADPHPPAGRIQAVHTEVARLRQAVCAEALNLQEILAGVVGLLDPITHQAGICISVSPAQGWPLVIADRVMLRQALLNLLSYALDRVVGELAIAARTEQGSLFLDIHGPLAPAGLAGSSVAPGQPKMSLEVAQALIQAQGGQCHCDWQAGHLRVQVSFDVAAPAVTILAIDDNADIVALLQRYLAGHRATVVGAAEAEQALRLAAELRPKLITLDVMMPSLDGWEILQRLKASAATRDIPVIICSVVNEPRLAQAMGASDYVTKPVDQSEVLKVFRRWLGPLQPAV